MLGKLNEHMRFNETALSLRAQRQQLLASNIANADTPNYKARDIDFASALKNAVAQKAGEASAPPAVMARTQAGHLGNTGASADFLPNGTPIQYRMAAQGSADNNTVDMDVERNQFADNALRYEAAVTFINSQIRGMITAIQGQ
ncbi:flagellar basal body rod protein FlgB [Massilia sp. PAMC28688]|uniref:flagellar basal body rod protein FlgB n=1 Tax=Massilia sp. PAMC28688 TaxID=2861283 RepID=UPI001C62C0DA|nr:flagellar basal body rod protein FlgB [Massilia sp. PAMC28688]QYF92009.1 flagellar basal body rod protein FlgB [Massilia sp. PAMC28688]